MQNTINRNLLKHAAGRAIFCKCGDILDARSAVLVTFGSRTAVVCATCFDKVTTLPPDVEVLDGREVFK